MADLFINISLSKWLKRPFNVQTTVDRGESAETALRRSTGLHDAITEGEVPIELVRDSLASYLDEAFSTGEARCFAKVYGDDTPMGEDWRLYIDGITQAEIDRREDLMGDPFEDSRRSDALVRMVRLDEASGLLDDFVERPRP